MLSPEELHAVAWKTAIIHSFAACVVPLMAFRVLLSWQEIRRNLLFIYLAIAASVVPMMLLAVLNDEFPAVAVGLIGLLITVWMARRRVGIVDDQPATEEAPVTSAQSVVNLTFRPIQDSIAAQLGQDRTSFLALQSVGGAMGNMVAIHNIVAVSSVLGLTNKEGEILRQTVGPMLIYGAIAAIVSLWMNGP
ncbi:MAG: L-lactate permease [Planctomyces sp.]|nr:L-lactate permease [Planctomyces sp.]